ncbi:exodeoxyribonuclease III [Tremella mesenterica]|uniref:DNA-(apurinic or apyrimidinic site) endonuclease n=1 Tax=Tremella mesenterica TaxID=5217 RepID=A0A4V1M4I7_TREME|nr:exodeoxyribonuclease III [Tremella mesenterica]
MRILTWNVNVLRTCLDYHPYVLKRNIEGLLDELGAHIVCFQEHKTRRPQLDKFMACPGPYDAFWTFPRSKTGYSGVCTYVDSRICVPLKAEEGITGLLLGDSSSTMRPPWSAEERIGCYPDMEELSFENELDGSVFDPKRLDMEGRAVVCDFGLFVLFNLYCPNETNDSRRPYKMNFFHALQARVRALQAAGREVIIAGDINIMRAPIDSGEGGIRTSAEQHYQHPARVILNDWCAPKGPMIDVVRESRPDRDDMFTCWNQKLDARPSNYGSRIDLILCTPGLRPWIKGGDIVPKVYGSDHCPVYIDLHESISLPSGQILTLHDALNPLDRPPTTTTIFPSDVTREAPEPPRFATKFWDEFSGRQTTLKSFFGSGPKVRSVSVISTGTNDVSPSPVAGPSSGVAGLEKTAEPIMEARPSISVIEDTPQTPFGMARMAFNSIDNPSTSTSQPRSSSGTQKRKTSIEIIYEDEPSPKRSTSQSSQSKELKTSNKNKSKPPSNGQTKLSSFFAQPPSSAKRKSPPTPVLKSSKSPKSLTTPASPAEKVERGTTVEEDALIAQALAEADEVKAQKRAKTNAEAAPVWSNLFAKKIPPLCTVHQQPCKDFIVKIPGPNKGKRFWLCSLLVLL